MTHSLDMEPLLADRMRHVPRSCIRDIMSSSSGTDTISFAGGLPAADLLPRDAVAGALDRVLTKGSAFLQYSATEGNPVLREFIVERLLRPRGLTVRVDDVLIVSGSQQALDLIGKVLVDRGCSLALERPSYLAAIQAFSMYRPVYRSVAMDRDGVLPDDLDRTLRAHSPRFFYTVPDFQNPTGRLCSQKRRTAIRDSLVRHRVLAVEDAPYSALAYDVDPGPMLSSGIEGGAVVLGTFSKLLAPAFRVGWIAAPPGLAPQLLKAKQASDLCTGEFVQQILIEMLLTLDLERHIMRLRHAYRQRRDAMISALRRHMPAGVLWDRPPGGMFIWCTLPKWLCAEELLAQSAAQGVVFAPGTFFHADGCGRNTMRLNFTHAEPARIKTGVGLLADAVRRLSG